MALKKDKKKVIGEDFDEARIRSFLDYKPFENQNPSYHLLEKAYRGMKSDNFATFVQIFVDSGYDINATNGAGKTFLQEISDHRHSEDYVAALKEAGAQ